tara:strand:- start:97 stop:837 length:741 start_codon:yes stop_codon:yes gene_type:complete
MNITINYSPNFEIKKRKFKEIKFLVFHYTGMKREIDAIKKLTSNKSKVSSHYFIKNNGEILSLVPDLYIAWHAGVSAWRKYKSINKYSIGIEISNPGHDNIYSKFSKKQIRSISKLGKFLIKKYDIKPIDILGHSDIAPDRKKDPGEKFPWKYLSKNKIGYWHGLNKNILEKKRKISLKKNNKLKFIKNLIKIGYRINSISKTTNYSKVVIKAFQRRFRPELINGLIDQECLLISKNLLKKIDKIS